MYNLMQDAFKALDEIKDDEIFAPVFKQRGMAKPVNESKETKKAATKVVENAKRKEARKPIEESCNALKKELKEEPQYDLKPQYDSRKSFYGKAWVDDKGNGTKVLYSYRTPVVRIEDGKVTLLRKGYLGWSSSPTTLRHVKDFLKQNGFEAGSVNDIAKMYPTEQARVDESYRKCESLVNLYNKDEVRKAKQCLEDKAEEKDSEVIVDADAETVDELKDSYVGCAILRCPVCKTLVYRKPEELAKDEGKDLYNIEDECPHCHEKDGFELVGQVAKMDNGKEDAEEEDSLANDSAEDVTVDNGSADANADGAASLEDGVDIEQEGEEEHKRTTKFGESLGTNVSIDEIDEGRFDNLVNQYLASSYNNVEGYSTTAGSVDDFNNKIVLEGTIKYKSGKEKGTRFVFEARTMTKGGRVRLSGINETFSKSRNAFSLFGRIDESNCLKPESMRYSYGVKVMDESKQIKGKAEIIEGK